MSTPEIFETIAYGLAASHYISEAPNKDAYENYIYICECLDKGQTPDDIVLWEPFESYDLKRVFELIEKDAQGFLILIRNVLKTTKLGMVLAANNDEFDTDLNNLDLESMFIRGVLEGGDYGP